MTPFSSNWKFQDHLQWYITMLYCLPSWHITVAHAHFVKIWQHWWLNVIPFKIFLSLFHYSCPHFPPLPSPPLPIPLLYSILPPLFTVINYFCLMKKWNYVAYSINKKLQLNYASFIQPRMPMTIINLQLKNSVILHKDIKTNGHK